MPTTEYINGIECVFPESREESLRKFMQVAKQTLLDEIEKGNIPASILDDLLHDEGYTDEDIKRLLKEGVEKEWMKYKFLIILSSEM